MEVERKDLDARDDRGWGDNSDGDSVRVGARDGAGRERMRREARRRAFMVEVFMVVCCISHLAQR